MQKRTSWIITKMHRPHLLYSLPSPHWSCCCLRHPLSRSSQNPKISTRNLSHEILILWTFHCTRKKFLLNHSRFDLCCSSLSYHAHSFFYYPRTRRLHFYSNIFDFKLNYWIFIHLCVLWENFTFFESWKTSKIYWQELLVSFGVWSLIFSSVFDNNFGNYNKKVTIQKYCSCVKDRKNMFLVEYLHAFCFNITVNCFNSDLVP